MYNVSYMPLYTCQLFLSQMREVFVLSGPEFLNIPDDFRTTSESCQKFPKMFRRPFNDDILVCCVKVKRLFELFLAILNLIFVINHVLKNSSSGFVSQAWEIVLDAWVREIDVLSLQAWDSRIMRESWQVYMLTTGFCPHLWFGRLFSCLTFIKKFRKFCLEIFGR